MLIRWRIKSKQLDVTVNEACLETEVDKVI